MTPTHLSVVSMPLETRREAVLHLATTADRLGYDSIYLPETWSWDVTVALAELASRTRSIRLGSAVLGIWGRSAATLAMAASTLHAVSEGRFTLGLGVSTGQLAEGFHDVPFDAPVARLRPPPPGPVSPRRLRPRRPRLGCHQLWEHTSAAAS